MANIQSFNKCYKFCLLLDYFFTTYWNSCIQIFVSIIIWKFLSNTEKISSFEVLKIPVSLYMLKKVITGINNSFYLSYIDFSLLAVLLYYIPFSFGSILYPFFSKFNFFNTIWCSYYESEIVTNQQIISKFNYITKRRKPFAIQCWKIHIHRHFIKGHILRVETIAYNQQQYNTFAASKLLLYKFQNIFLCVGEVF